MASDTDYLKGTVGDALARGVAATIAAQPPDAVEYLGNWLLKCVFSCARVDYWGGRGRAPTRRGGSRVQPCSMLRAPPARPRRRPARSPRTQH
jgi:hypothetical protein